MIGEVIQEYLVALGAKIDKPGFREMDQTIQQSGELITRATGSWAANFVKASTIIASAIAGVKAATLGLMTAAAKQDLEMEKYARSMMMSRDAAEQMKRATDALGESINDITLSPELSERFRELSADGGQMLVGGDFKETMRNFRDLIFQWTRLKQEASYAMTWIGYYLAKYLQKPLAEIRERFREFNDNFVKNISTWTEKAARAIVYILEIGRHFLTFLWDVGKALYNIWDSFPKGVKIATAALAGFWAIMRMSPLGRMITLVSALMLLIDDYYAYMEGKNAALGPLWDNVNDAIARAKELWAETLPILEDFSKKVEKIVKDFFEWLVELSQDEDVKNFVESVKELGKAVFDLGIEIFKLIYGALSALFEGFDQTDGIHTFKEALRGVLRVSTVLNKWMKILTDSIKKVFSTVRESHTFKQFWEQQGKSVEAFIRIIEKALKATGKLGEALIALKDGEFTKAWDLAKQGWNELKAGVASVPSAMNGGLIGSAVQAGLNFGKQIAASWSGTDNQEENARAVYNTFKAAGYSDEAIAGIMGRVQQEHNFSTSNVEEHDVWMEDYGEYWHVGGYGMFQWNGGRTDRFLNWAQENGLDPQNPYTQSAFALVEARERGLTPEYMNTMGAEDAATVWTDDWEVGEHGYEREYARDWRNQIYAWHQNPESYYAEAPAQEQSWTNQNALLPYETASVEQPTQENTYVADAFEGRQTVEPVKETGWNDAIAAMQTAFMSSGVYQTPPYIGGASSSHTVTIGDINVTIEGGANATAEDIGQKFQDVMYTFTSRTMIGQTI